jgi:hypothetical protein
MSVRPKLARALVGVAYTAFVLAGCSSSPPRDLNYGTDVGAGYIPPDATAKTSPEDAAGAEVVPEDAAGAEVAVPSAKADSGIEVAPTEATDAGVDAPAESASDAPISIDAGQVDADAVDLAIGGID